MHEGLITVYNNDDPSNSSQIKRNIALQQEHKTWEKQADCERKGVCSAAV